MTTIRTARFNGTCGAPGCLAPIFTGSAIVKPPGKAWQHADCSRPGPRRTPDGGRPPSRKHGKHKRNTPDSGDWLNAA